MDRPTVHALLRDRSHWRGDRVGLVAAVDGAERGDLILERVPGPADAKPVVLATPLPYPRVASGIAPGPCGEIFVADTAHGQVVFIERCASDCATRAFGVPAADAAAIRFASPLGLACATDALLVADSGTGRVQRLVWPRLEAHLAFETWSEPVALAIDAQQRVVVVDRASGSLHRVHPHGAPDAAFDAAVAAGAMLVAPLFVACDASSRVYVADTDADEVFVFAADGGFAFTLPGTPGWQPGAIAVAGERIYVADAASATIVVYAATTDGALRIGVLPAWQGPVTALAVGGDGTLYIKPGVDATFYCFAADIAFMPSGTLTAGPFDAGEECVWERAWADASVPAATALRSEVALATAPTAAPSAADWIALPAPDVLLATVASGSARFVWWRLTLTTSDPALSPRLRQARVATAAEDLLDHLPLCYRRADDDAGQFLSRWLRLLRGENLRIEEALDAMPRLADPMFSTPESLSWLAAWLGLELPQIADDAERRRLVARAVQLFARRGTPQSIAEFVELHTGVRPAIVEAFAQRRIWMLGTSSRLGFDTCLAPLDPLGLVVPDPASESGCCPTEAPQTAAPMSPCADPSSAAESAANGTAPNLAIGRAIVGESGPLAPSQIGLPLFADDAYRFCVVVDSYRVADAATRQELERIVEREKPAHTDYRIELVAAEMRVGLQALIGIDAIVGGEPPPLRLGDATVSVTTNLPPADTARVGEAALDGTLTLL